MVAPNTPGRNGRGPTFDAPAGTAPAHPAEPPAAPDPVAALLADLDAHLRCEALAPGSGSDAWRASDALAWWRRARRLAPWLDRPIPPAPAGGPLTELQHSNYLDAIRAWAAGLDGARPRPVPFDARFPATLRPAPNQWAPRWYRAAVDRLIGTVGGRNGA